MRIFITGNAGAGKTTLAKDLAAQLSVPAFHLDQIVWQPHWQKAPEHERAEALEQITQTENWIIEGVSEVVRLQADLTIFLDVPRFICLLRCLKRNLPYLFRSRPELPAHCPEILIFPRLIRIIWNFPHLVGKRLSLEANHSNNIRVATNKEQVADTLNEFRSLA